MVTSSTERLVYVVVGEIGEYSDRKMWGVRVFSDQALVQAFVEAVSAEARELLAHVNALGNDWPDDYDEQVDAVRCALDPHLTGEDLANHYDGVSYFVWELPS